MVKPFFCVCYFEVNDVIETLSRVYVVVAKCNQRECFRLGNWNFYLYYKGRRLNTVAKQRQITYKLANILSIYLATYLFLICFTKFLDGTLFAVCN